MQSGFAHLDPISALAEIGVLFGAQPLDPQWPQMLTGMHDKQRCAVVDPSKRKAILGGRRAGKTESAVYWLLEGWRQHPGKRSVYVATTIGSARDIMWDKLRDICDRWELGATFNESRLEARLPNGYTIWITGCENRKQSNRVGRGKKFRRVVIDELEIFEDELIRYFINSSLKPTLMDYGGELLLLGTPGFALQGFWFDVTEDDDADEEKRGKRRAKRWPTHRFSALDNPFIGYAGGAAQFFADELEDVYGGDANDPDYIRELLGKWVRDATAYIYPYAPDRNLWDEQDDDTGWGNDDTVKTVIGVDIGDRDGCGFSVVRKRWDSDEIRVLESYSTVNLDNDELAIEIRKLMARYKTHHVYMDSKGHGATTICKSMLNYGIPAKPAENNHKKLPLIRDTRAVLRNGRLRMHPTKCRDLILQFKTLTWNEDHDSHQEGIPDESVDATLWAVFECRKLAAVSKQSKAARAQPGSEEYEQLQDQLENMRAEKNAERMKRLGNPTHRAKGPSKGRATGLARKRT